jgi:hypothetical protein
MGGNTFIPCSVLVPTTLPFKLQMEKIYTFVWILAEEQLGTNNFPGFNNFLKKKETPTVIVSFSVM